MFSDEAREVFAQALLQGTQRLLQSRLVSRGNPHLPPRQPRDQLDPLAPRERRPAPALELAEAGDEVAREALLANASTLEEPRDDREHLARMHRLHEVIVDLGADRVAQQRDRKSTRLNSSHGYISYAVFCLKKKIPSRWRGISRRRRRGHT